MKTKKTGPSKRDVAFALTSTQAQIVQTAGRLARAFDPAQQAELVEELECLKRAERGFRAVLRSFQPEQEPAPRFSSRPQLPQALTVIRRPLAAC